MANRSRVIALSVNDLKELERLVRASSTPAGLSRRARAILLMSEGLSGVEVADKTGYTDVQVSRIRRRFAEEGMAGLHERARSGRPPVVIFQNHDPTFFINMPPGSKAYPIINTTTSSDL